MNSINFLHPLAFLLLPVFLICIKYCPQKENSILFSNITLLSNSKKRFSLISFFQLLTLFFLTITLASPYSFETYKKNKTDSTYFLLVIDTSLSIKESFEDIKHTLKDFIKSRNSDTFSLIYFADYIAVGAPPTQDTNFLLSSIDSVKSGDLGEIKTRLYDALDISLSNPFAKKSAKEKIVILLSDGIDKGSKKKLNELLSDLKQKHLKLYTIGFGYDYDKELLTAMAKTANGEFFMAKDIDSLKKVIKHINSLYTYKKEKKSYLVKKPLYQIPLFFTFLSLLFFTYLLNKRAVI